MSRLNYQHLFYFWNVVKEGGVTRACEKLHLAQPTISGQLAVFEEMIGKKLYYKEGKKLVLSEAGRLIFRYADEIFRLGQELSQTLQGHDNARGIKLNVGIADALPKLIAFHLLAPALQISEPVQLTCYEDKTERLITEIALHNIDIVLSDVPSTQTMGTRIFNHSLGNYEIGVFGVKAFEQIYSTNFPESLKDAPFLLPSLNNALRRTLDQWFDKMEIYPIIKAEIEDSALLKTFAASGLGIFFAPIAVQSEIQERYGCYLIGRISELQEQFYAITAQRRIKHPAIIAILEKASVGALK